MTISISDIRFANKILNLKPSKGERSGENDMRIVLLTGCITYTVISHVYI